MILVFAVLAIAFAGCVSFTPQQTSLFTDEDGNLVSVEYGRSKSDHESKFTSPNGKVLTMKSKLGVRVTLPDGDDFMGWECMNPLRSGTMYRSNNEKWMYHANGISCTVFKKALNPQGKEDYLVVFLKTVQEIPFA